jgi:hypothetical protein
MFRAAVGVGQGPISIYPLDSEPEPRPGANPVVVLGQVNLGPRRRGQVNLGPRRRGDGVRLTATKPILPAPADNQKVTLRRQAKASAFTGTSKD